MDEVRVLFGGGDGDMEILPMVGQWARMDSAP